MTFLTRMYACDAICNHARDLTLFYSVTCGNKTVKLQERLITGLRRGIYCTAVSVNALIAINEQAAIKVLIFISFFIMLIACCYFVPSMHPAVFCLLTSKKKKENTTLLNCSCFLFVICAAPEFKLRR